jgi:hypothetical protein
MRPAFLLQPLPLLLLAASLPAHADTTYYENTSGYQFGVANGGATSPNGPTTIEVDDIQVGPAVGLPVNTITYSVYNGNNTALTVTPTLYVFDDDAGGPFAPGVYGYPGTLVYSVTLAPVTVDADTASLSTYSPGGDLFLIPDTVFYAGLTFSGSGLTLDELNNFGLGFYGPPTVGSSDSYQEYTSAPYSGGSFPQPPLFTDNYPDYQYPVGFAFAEDTQIAATPEPSSLSLLGLGVAVIGASLRKLRRQA